LISAAESLADQPFCGTQLAEHVGTGGLTKCGNQNRRETSVSLCLRDSLYAELPGDVAGIVAVRLDSIDALPIETDSGFVDQRG
jgi:hypothetical protein